MARSEDRSREEQEEKGKGEEKSEHSRDKNESEDLAEREYRDADGNIRHHTRSYMEGHDEEE